MSIQVALLRAVNVGGTGRLPMADLRALAAKLGLGDPRTLLQSGNLVFEAGARKTAASEALLEAALAKSFGIATDIYVRTAAELGAVVARNPFAKEARSDPALLHVLFHRTAPDGAAYKTLRAAIKGPEYLEPGGRHTYVVYPAGSGNSKLTPAVLARHLGQPGTARNWNTLTKLLALAGDDRT